MSAKFIGELVLQEILCSWHQVLQALHTLQGVLFVFVLLNILSFLSYRHFGAQSYSFMSDARDEKVLKEP